ncbi:hypothetical protein [Hydrogenophaga sp. 2FB]|uniref:hypothetical protein n=1 Tax=Hydrogenophaga sp. 2FB TaxID=2502187 RepID=UPI0010F5A4CE|nr:hypothetical protein [Hydrogenophaga sp. 2FB]
MGAISEINHKVLSVTAYDAAFVVLTRGQVKAPGNTPSATRPLLVIVHPGDALEPPFGWSHADYQAVLGFSLSNQVGMSAEILARVETCEVFVLHRSSSSDLLSGGAARWVDPSYAKAVRRASEVGSVAYGDDLTSAADWICASTELMAGREVFMTGAYADAVHGCITALGSSLLGAQPDLKINVSDHAPTDNANHAPRWVPSAAKPGSPFTPAQKPR